MSDPIVILMGTELYEYIEGDSSLNPNEIRAADWKMYMNAPFVMLYEWEKHPEDLLCRVLPDGFTTLIDARDDVVLFTDQKRLWLRWGSYKRWAIYRKLL